MGLYRAAGDLGMVVGPVLLGWMSDTWSFKVALYFNCIFLLFTVITFQILAKEAFNKRPTPVQSVD
jgi:MFS family permease